MIGLFLLGGLLSCAPIKSAPGGCWTEFLVNGYPVYEVSWSGYYGVAIVDTGAYNKIYQYTSGVWTARAIPGNPSVWDAIAIGAEIFAYCDDGYIWHYSGSWSTYLAVGYHYGISDWRTWDDDESTIVARNDTGSGYLDIIKSTGATEVVEADTGEIMNSVDAYGDIAVAAASNGKIYRVAAGTYAYTNPTSPFGTTSIVRVRHVGRYWIIVSINGEIAASLDDGETFTAVGNCPYGTAMTDLEGTDEILFGINDYGDVYRSSDVGAKWTLVGNVAAVYLHYDEANGRLYAWNNTVCYVSDWIEAGAGIVKDIDADISIREYANGDVEMWGRSSITLTSTYYNSVGVTLPRSFANIGRVAISSDPETNSGDNQWVGSHGCDLIAENTLMYWMLTEGLNPVNATFYFNWWVKGKMV